MSRPTFNIDLYSGAWTSYIVCSGELDVCSAAELQAAIDRSLEKHCHTVIFNGAGITLLTADAVEVLMEGASRCRAEAVNFEVILSERSWKLVELLGVTGLLSPPPGEPASHRDYEIPHEVAKALRDVMDEGELRDAFFSDSLTSALRGREDVTTT